MCHPLTSHFQSNNITHLEFRRDWIAPQSERQRIRWTIGLQKPQCDQEIRKSSTDATGYTNRSMWLALFYSIEFKNYFLLFLTYLQYLRPYPGTVCLWYFLCITCSPTATSWFRSHFLQEADPAFLDKGGSPVLCARVDDLFDVLLH